MTNHLRDANHESVVFYITANSSLLYPLRASKAIGVLSACSPRGRFDLRPLDTSYADVVISVLASVTHPRKNIRAIRGKLWRHSAGSFTKTR